MARRLARFVLVSHNCGFVAGGLPAEVEIPLDHL